MQKYIPILKKTQLFEGVEAKDITVMLSCFGARLKRYKKGEYILRQGDFLKDITVLVEGDAHIQRDDYWGNRSILSNIAVGEMFGEAYVAPDSGALLNDVVAVEDSAVMFFDVNRILNTCPSSCPFHSTVVQNMFYAICEKNKALVQKLRYMSGRTTREKLMSYLSEQAKKHGKHKFYIPFNRQQLADFLSVDRSAMSDTLCKMRDEGLLKFYKNHFELL